MIEAYRMKNERGYTLVELVVAAVILSIISFALTESLLAGFENSGEAREQLKGSVDRQRVAKFFVADVQSAGPFEETPPCPPDPAFLTFNWTDGNVDKRASYVQRFQQGEHQLWRRYCEKPVGTEDVPPNWESIAEEALAGLAGPGSLGRECPPSGQCSSSSLTISLTVVGSDGEFVVVATRRSS